MTIAMEFTPAAETRRCRRLAIELNNAGVALMSQADASGGEDVESSQRALGGAIRMMQLCLRRRRDAAQGRILTASPEENGVEHAEEALGLARQRLHDCDRERSGGNDHGSSSSSSCGPLELELALQEQESGEDGDADEASTLQALREDCAVMMHNLALSHARDASSSSSQFKALSYLEMALLLLQSGPRDSATQAPSSCGGAATSSRSGAQPDGESSSPGATAAQQQQARCVDRAALVRRLILSAVSESARIHGGLGNHAAAEEYGNELSRLLMMMTEEELAEAGMGVGDDAPAAAA